jgi:hypothetical protein
VRGRIASEGAFVDGLAGMKMRVIQVGGSWVAHGVDVPTGLAAVKAIDERFEAATSIRSRRNS